MLNIPDKWIWDSWYCQSDDGLWHAFYLQADKALGDPELRHWNVTHGHATSPDLRDWTVLGTAFAPAPGPAFDDLTVWTGSVLHDHKGGWVMHYTGTSRAEQGLEQRIGRARSDDLAHWQRDGLALELNASAAPHYEGHVPGRWKDASLRDPWVIADPDGDGWLMYFTARSPVPAESFAAGAIGMAHSADLQNWEFLPPAYVGSFGEIEVPQVFERNGRWYCLFCTTARYWSEDYRATYPGSPTSGVHYLVADNARGPWRVAEGPFLLATEDCDYYAPRMVTHQGQDYLLVCHAGAPDAFRGEISDPMALSYGPKGQILLGK